MRKLLTISIAGLLAAAATFVLAQPGLQLVTSLVGTEVVSLASPGAVSNGTTLTTLWGYGRAAGLLYTTTATAGTSTGTAEQTLATYSLPGGTLNTGTKLRIYASFSAAGNGNNKTFRCYFGSSVVTSGVLTTNAKNGDCSLVVTKVGTAHQIVWGKMLVDTTAITDYVNAASAEDDTAAITIKFTGTDGTSSAGDIIMNDFFVERLGR